MGLFNFLTKVGNYIMGQGFETDSEKADKKRKQAEAEATAAATAAKTAQEQAAMAGEAAERLRLRRTRGFLSTLLAGATPTSTLNSSVAAQRKTLLGG